MDKSVPTILYISNKLPCTSETFVYNEVLQLKRRGWKIYTASVHEPDINFGNVEVDTLALDSIRVYPQGFFRIAINCVKEVVRHPKIVASTLSNSIKTIFSNRKELTLLQSLKFIVQTLGAISIAEQVRNYSVTHIHAHFAHVPTSVAMVLSDHLSIPFSFTGHAVDLFSEQCLLKEKLSKASFCGCISEWHKQFYRSLHQLPDDKLPIIRCGVNVDTFYSTKEPTSIEQEVRIVSVARLVPKKGIDLLIKALENVNFGSKRWSCQIIGDGSEKEYLQTLIVKSKHKDKIQLLGNLSNEEVRCTLQKSHIFVLPCRVDNQGNKDGIPVALMEAMACENAVISSDFPQFRELVEHGVSGFLTASGDIEKVSEYIEKLVHNTPLCNKMGLEGRAKVLEEFSAELNISRLEFSFLRALGSTCDTSSQFVKLSQNQLRKTENYVIISPCRNEGKYLRNTLESVVNQTALPKKWIIVDDGSTDETPLVLKEYSKKYPFIEVIRREDRGYRQVGPGVVDAFYVGYNSLNDANVDYICKLDLDLKLPLKYFEVLIDRMKADPRIGTCSGRPYYVNRSGYVEMEPSSDDISVGMTKFYRNKCFQEMGGIVREVMWDGIDCHRSRMLGWKSYSWDEPNLRFYHLRPMGSSQHGIITGRMRHGYGQYFMGTSWLYITASSISRLTKYPFIIGGISMWLGYMKALLTNADQYGDEKFRTFLRRYQRTALLKGKKAASKITNEETQKIWEQKDRV